MPTLNRTEIEARIPHRAPMLWLTAVEDWEPATMLRATHTFTLENEPHLRGHFPGNPIIPGVFLVEALAQAAALLAGLTKDVMADGALYLFAGIEQTRFSAIARPGVKLFFEVEQIFDKRGILKFDGRVTDESGTILLKNTFQAKMVVKEV